MITIKRSVRRPAPAPRPSRIRRDPVPVKAQKAVKPYPTEREIWTVAIGVILFALAIAVITVAVSDYTSH
ncbi:MAG TPA: hypothetical protein VFK19_00970 [Sphingomicrobium sp.]|nr:hypothetical protein [Sphingomicrobium sp.]